jgi:hypothetical protein
MPPPLCRTATSACLTSPTKSTSPVRRSGSFHVTSGEARAVNMSREAALAFLEADANGDGILEWNEFVTAVTKLRKHDGCSAALNATNEKELRELFDTIDKDGSGTIEMDEYFLCAPRPRGLLPPPTHRSGERRPCGRDTGHRLRARLRPRGDLSKVRLQRRGHAGY